MTSERDPWEAYRRDIRQRYAGVSPETLHNLANRCQETITEQMVLREVLREMAREIYDREHKSV